MKQNEWIIVVAVIIIVAVIASLVTVNLTGNVIKLNQDTYGKYKVYTASEVDGMLDKLSKNYGFGLCSSALKISLNSNATNYINLMYQTYQITGKYVSQNAMLLTFNGVSRDIIEGQTTEIDGWKITAQEIISDTALITINSC